MFAASVICDSLSAYTGSRLVSLELTYPRRIHSEIMTHRVFSRNAASSRAIPVSRTLEQVRNNPFIPNAWGINEKGMQASKNLESPEDIAAARHLWLEARDCCIESAERLLAMGIHKQEINRMLEPWMWITVILSGTQWSNFFAQRCHKDAEPHMRLIAEMVRDAMSASVPLELKKDDWHLPYFSRNDEATKSLNLQDCIRASVARCARVSYLRNNEQFDLVADINLYERLLSGGHWSPFEHIATPASHLEGLNGNFDLGWTQYRKTFHGECR